MAGGIWTIIPGVSEQPSQRRAHAQSLRECRELNERRSFTLRSREGTFDEPPNPCSDVLFRSPDRFRGGPDPKNRPPHAERSAGYSGPMELCHAHASRTARGACSKGILHGTASGGIRTERNRTKQHGPARWERHERRGEGI